MAGKIPEGFNYFYKNNIIRIVGRVKAHCVIIYGHHILREVKYKERFKEVYEKAGKKLMTAAEYMGEQSMIDNRRNRGL